MLYLNIGILRGICMVDGINAASSNTGKQIIVSEQRKSKILKTDRVGSKRKIQ